MSYKSLYVFLEFETNIEFAWFSFKLARSAGLNNNNAIYNYVHYFYHEQNNKILLVNQAIAHDFKRN